MAWKYAASTGVTSPRRAPTSSPSGSYRRCWASPPEPSSARTSRYISQLMTPRALLPRWLAILLVSLAGLLLEVGYTRIVSFKLYYYYVYLVIGLALLGIGTGGVVVAIARPLRKWTTERIIGVCSVWGAVSIAIGY